MSFSPSLSAYSFIRELGRGSFSTVYLCIHLSSHCPVALKAVPLSSSLHPSRSVSMDTVRLTTELSIHSELKHPGIVELLGHFREQDMHYMVMEAAEGNLGARVNGPVEESKARMWFRQIAEAVGFLKKQGVVHRDIKMANVLVMKDGMLKICDFGMASRVEENEMNFTMCGTPNYIAPEIVARSGHGFAVDIWSLGCLLFTLLAGKPPFESDELKSTLKRASIGDFTLPSSCSSDACDLIMRLLQPEPALRPTIEAVLQHPFCSSVETAHFLPPRTTSLEREFFQKQPPSKFTVPKIVFEPDGDDTILIANMSTLSRISLNQSNAFLSSTILSSFNDFNGSGISEHLKFGNFQPTNQRLKHSSTNFKEVAPPNESLVSLKSSAAVVVNAVTLDDQDSKIQSCALVEENPFSSPQSSVEALEKISTFGLASCTKPMEVCAFLMFFDNAGWYLINSFKRRCLFLLF